MFYMDMEYSAGVIKEQGNPKYTAIAGCLWYIIGWEMKCSKTIKNYIFTKNYIYMFMYVKMCIYACTHIENKLERYSPISLWEW